jgi:hypothetical protein
MRLSGRNSGKKASVGAIVWPVDKLFNHMNCVRDRDRKFRIVIHPRVAWRRNSPTEAAFEAFYEYD